MNVRFNSEDAKVIYSALPPPTICTSSMITRYHSHVTNGLLCLEISRYDTPPLLGRFSGGRAVCRSFFRTLYVVMHTSYLLMYKHHSSLLSSGAGVSSSPGALLLLPRVVVVGFVDLLREAVVVVLACMELNFDHPS